LPHASAQYPGPHLHVVACIIEIHPSLTSQPLVPGGIYLHEAVVKRAVFIVVDGSGVEIAFGFCDGPKKLRRYPILLPSLFEAESTNILRSEDHKGDGKKTLFHRKNIPNRNKAASENEKRYSFGDPTVKNRTPILFRGSSEGT